MLSEKRSKIKWSVDPNGTNWARDTNKFGTKMLEKMGWTQGKGLGANEDGCTEHIKVRVKNNNLGVGCSLKSVHNWVAHQDDFSNLLASLNDEHNDNEDCKTEEVSTLEKSSKSQKRVHYHKFTRGKDLSNYRKDDLNAIFGKRAVESAPVTPADSSDTGSSDDDGTVSCPEEDKSKSKPLFEHRNQVTSTMNVKEYFALRMVAIKNKTSDENPQPSDSVQDTTESGGRKDKTPSETKRLEDAIPTKKKKRSTNVEMTEDPSTPVKKKKKKSLDVESSQEQSLPVKKKKKKCLEVETVENLALSKKKKSKKVVTESTDDVDDCDKTEAMKDSISNNENSKEKKKMKKKRKKSRTDIDENMSSSKNIRGD